MSIVDDLVTDRNEKDVAEWLSLRAKGLSGMAAEERSKWMAGMKGSYTPAIDMNRVGNAISYIADLLNGYGYSVQVSPKTNWAIGDIPTPVQLQQYLACVSTLRAVLEVLPTTPEVPADMEGLTVQEANDIERILVDIDSILTAMQKSMLYASQPLLCCGYAVYMVAVNMVDEHQYPTFNVDTATGELSATYPDGYNGPTFGIDSDGNLIASYPEGYTGPEYTLTADGYLTAE